MKSLISTISCMSYLVVRYNILHITPCYLCSEITIIMHGNYKSWTGTSSTSIMSSFLKIYSASSLWDLKTSNSFISKTVATNTTPVLSSGGAILCAKGFWLATVGFRGHWQVATIDHLSTHKTEEYWAKYHSHPVQPPNTQMRKGRDRVCLPRLSH